MHASLQPLRAFSMHTLARFGFILCLLALPASAGHTAEPAPTDVTLTKRTDNGAYGTSAYSFRLASQDYAVHRNYVDLVFNGCGQLHVNPVNGMSSRIVDLGAIPLDPPAATPPTDAAWHQRSITPQAGHVYYQEIKDERQSFAVEFLVTAASADTVKLRWESVDPSHKVLPLPSGKGAAGTMGQCGGMHSEK